MVKLFSGFFLTALLWNGALAAESQKIITIYGLEQGKLLNRSKQNEVSYVLQVGAFKSQSNALNCQKNYSNKTNFPIHIQNPNKAHGAYFVIMGPFADPQELKNISQQLLSHKKIEPGKAVAKIKEPVKIKQVAQTSAVLMQENSPKAPVTLETKNNNLLVDATVSKKYSQVLMDSETLQSNQIAKNIQSTGKIKLGSTERKSIENRAWELKAELSAIDLKLQTETNPQKIAALEKRKESVNKELEKIVAMVIKRISIG